MHLEKPGLGSRTDLGVDPSSSVHHPVAPNLKCLLKQGHCEIQQGSVMDRDLHGALFSEWWFSSLLPALFVLLCFI